jgi:predicted dehydrogenase
MKKITGNKVIWGIIGVGDVCEKKSSPAMNKIPGSYIKSVMRRNAEKAEDFAKRHGISNWYSNAENILNDPEINAVYIATPPETHAEYTLKAAQAGKAVYVEKPMARNYAECLTMIEACEKANVPLFVAYYRRALPNFLKIKEIVDQGIIGNVRLVNIEMYKPFNPEIVTRPDLQWRVNPENSGGGLFHDLASHQFDYLDYLLGPIVEAGGISANQGKFYAADDIVSASFSFKNGVVGSGIWCFTSAPSTDKDKTTIIGSKGEIEFATFANSTVYLDSESTGKTKYHFETPMHIQEPLIRLVVNNLLGNAISPSNGITGARTSWVMEQICENGATI